MTAVPSTVRSSFSVRPYLPRGRCRLRSMATSERRLALERLSGLALTIDEANAWDAFGRTSALAEQHGLSVYDAAYLEVAVRRHLPLGTRDHALRAAGERSGIPEIDG